MRINFEKLYSMNTVQAVLIYVESMPGRLPGKSFLGSVWYDDTTCKHVPKAIQQPNENRFFTAMKMVQAVIRCATSLLGKSVLRTMHHVT